MASLHQQHIDSTKDSVLHIDIYLCVCIHILYMYLYIYSIYIYLYMLCPSPGCLRGTLVTEIIPGLTGFGNKLSSFESQETGETSTIQILDEEDIMISVWYPRLKFIYNKVGEIQLITAIRRNRFLTQFSLDLSFIQIKQDRA